MAAQDPLRQARRGDERSARAREMSVEDARAILSRKEDLWLIREAKFARLTRGWAPPLLMTIVMVVGLGVGLLIGILVGMSPSDVTP